MTNSRFFLPLPTQSSSGVKEVNVMIHECWRRFFKTVAQVYSLMVALFINDTTVTFRSTVAGLDLEMSFRLLHFTLSLSLPKRYNYLQDYILSTLFHGLCWSKFNRWPKLWMCFTSLVVLNLSFKNVIRTGLPDLRQCHTGCINLIADLLVHIPLLLSTIIFIHNDA